MSLLTWSMAPNARACVAWRPLVKILWTRWYFLFVIIIIIFILIREIY